MLKAAGKSARSRLTCSLCALVALVVACALLFALAGNARAADETPSPSAAKLVLKVGWPAGGPDTLNPLIMIQTSAYEMTRLNYNYLVGYSSSGLTARPELATSWTQADGGKTCTFKLRKGVRWQDGQPFTAKDVAFTFNFLIDNKIGNYLDYLGLIEDVVALDDYTVEFRCSAPKPNLVGLPVPILPEHIWGKFTGAEAQKFPNAHPVGTGPFQIVEYKRNNYLRLIANKDYWNGPPKIDELLYVIYENPSTMAGDLKNGQLDAIEGVPDPTTFKSLQNDPDLTVSGGAQNGYECLDINCYDNPRSLGNPVLRDVRFRQALQYAMDRNKVSALANRGLAPPGETMIPPHYYAPSLDYHWEPTAAQRYSFDLKKAGDMLTAAGYPLVNGVRVDKHGKPIQLRLMSVTGIEVTPRLIAGWLKQLGIKVQLTVLEDAALQARIYNTEGGQPAPDFDFFMWGPVTGDVDPNWIHSIFLTRQIGSWSWDYWSNPEYDKLFAAQVKEMDPQKRKELFWQMQELVHDQSPCIVLTHPQSLQAYDTSRWTGWVHTPSAKGTVLYAQENIDTYLYVHPVGSEQAAGGSSWSWLIVVAVIAVLGIAGVVLIMRRRARRALDE
jgi:peptide/nickel transport system substrate-binding protein